MISKGIDIYGYVDSSAFEILTTTPKSPEVKFSRSKEMQIAHREINWSDIGLFEHSGRFSAKITCNGASVFERYEEIVPITGNLNGGDLGNMLQTQSQIKSNQYAISYGFYDAGFGESDEFYAYVTGDKSDWMKDAVKANNLGSLSFDRFVLPGSHDAGMFTGVDSDAQARWLIDSVLEKFAGDHKTVTAAIGASLLSPAAAPMLPLIVPLVAGMLVVLETTSTPRRALINLSYTQKDPISKQLGLGARYFDFRPGYSPFDNDRSEGALRHQHSFIPGCRFVDFLKEVVRFLTVHTGEIVVVCTSDAGFLDSGMRPTQRALDDAITNSLSGADIKKGTLDDLKRTYQDLIKLKRRLIVLTNTDLSGKCRDSYSDPSYATNDPSRIIASLNDTLSQPQKDWTVLQLQGTYTNTKSGGSGGVVTLSDASSPLLSTKAPFDRATYEWVVSEQASVATRCGSGLLTLLNDFVDNALTDRCIELTVRRSRIPSVSVPGEYERMPFGFNNCPVQWAEMHQNVSLDDMIVLANRAGAKGFTYQPDLRHGQLMIGDYPAGCQSPTNQSWPLYLRKA